jgi:hypothetical protein
MADELRPDIAAAREQMKATMGSGKEVKRLATHLREGERVERLAQANRPGKPGVGLLALTDRRLLLVKERMFGAKAEDFTLDKISWVEWKSGLATGTATISSMGNKLEVGMNKDDGKAITDLLRDRISALQSASAATGSGQGTEPARDIPDQIRKLGELRDAGVLTEEEFEAKKAELLSRM